MGRYILGISLENNVYIVIRTMDPSFGHPRTGWCQHWPKTVRWRALDMWTHTGPSTWVSPKTEYTQKISKTTGSSFSTLFCGHFGGIPWYTSSGSGKCPFCDVQLGHLPSPAHFQTQPWIVFYGPGSRKAQLSAPRPRPKCFMRPAVFVFLNGGLHHFWNIILLYIY